MRSKAVSGVTRFRTAEMDEETSSLLRQTMKKVTEDIDSLTFNTAISAMMIVTNHLQGLKESAPLEAAHRLPFGKKR